MIGQTQSFSAGIAVKGFLCATLLTLVLIATLVLVSSADATLTVQLEGDAATVEVGASSAGATATAEGTVTTGEATVTTGEGTPAEQTSPTGEGSPSPTETSTPAEATPPGETTLPAEATAPAETNTPTEPIVVQTTLTETTHAEEASQPREGLLQEVVQTTQEPVSQAGEVLTPVIKEVVVPASELVVPAAPAEERAKPPETTKEAGQAEALAAPAAAGSPPAPPPSTPQAGILTAFPAIAMTEARERAERRGAAASRSLTAAERAGEISCELSGLSERMSEDCSAGLLAGSSLIAVDPVERADEASSVHKSVHAGGGYSEPAGGGRSGGAPPGPAPGGAFGGSAAAGSGLALSGFFTLAGLLLFAAPCAMRRLRLLCRPWRTAFFVLIPERPG